jgi:DNA-binding transcriptional ArsR family regulator
VAVRADALLRPVLTLTIFYHMVEYLSMTRAEARRLDRVYGAIADPTRRAILGILAGGEVNVGTLAGRFPISFNGVSKHVKVLEEAGLLRRSVRGREHWLQLRPQPLQDASRWLEHYREFWETRLDALEDFLVQEKGEASGKTQKRGGRTIK